MGCKTGEIVDIDSSKTLRVLLMFIEATRAEKRNTRSGGVASKPGPGYSVLYTDANLIPFDGILFIPGLFARCRGEIKPASKGAG